MVPIFSEFAADPQWQELLQDFAATIPNRITSIRRAMEIGDLAQLKTLVHQLRGACGSYGYHVITPLAAELEHSLLTSHSLNAHVEQLDHFVETLGGIVAVPQAQQMPQ